MTTQVQFRIVTKRKNKCNGKTLSCFLALLCLALLTVICQAEYFSSTDSIPMLANAENDLIQWYRKFLEEQAAEFAVYRNFVKKVKEEHNLALEDPEAFLGNPINAYKLIKRTVVDWGIITKNVRNNTHLQALKANLTSLAADITLPDNNDLHGAAKGLGRLQTMYNLSTADLADGFINDIYYDSKLSIQDCFEIGSNLFETKEYPLAKEWLQFVLKLLSIEGYGSNANSENDIEGEVNTKDKENEYENDTEEDDESEVEDNLVEFDDLIYEPRYGVFTPLELYELGENGNLVNETDSERVSNSGDHKVTLESYNENDAFDYTKDTTQTAFEKDPVIEKILIEALEYLALASYELGQQTEMLDYIDEILQINPEHVFKDLQVYMTTIGAEKNAADFDTLSNLQRYEWFANYSRLCQGKQVEQKELHQLSCKLDTLSNPLFILAPLKKEELHADPEIVVYHGLLNDKQIDDILDQSEAHMLRSGVGSTKVQIRDVRVSQQTWLSYHSPTLQYIYRTVSAISGFDLTNAESMQVANYGIGGQYDPHYDFFEDFDPNKKSPWIGNRIATHLFFASDVEQGGNTVFPYLNVYARPVKGSMVMWRNLHKSLDPDRRTLHAGCPVLKGTKRICNVWVHSGYQELSHPCDLVRDNYKSAHIR